MQTNFPTTELYFAFAFTYCKLRIYTSEEPLARKVLQMYGVEFLDESDSRSWQEFDTRILLRLLKESLPKLIEQSQPTAKETAERLNTFIAKP